MLTIKRFKFINPLVINYFEKCEISVCSCMRKNNSDKEARIMRKLISANHSKKKYYSDSLATKSVQAVVSDPTSQRRTPQRVTVLNKLFMTYITDLLATGDLAEDIVGRGMEVTSVSVNKDFQLIKVYWVAKSQEDEDFLAERLPQLSFKLRHELSQLYLVGHVPKVQFIIDKRSSRLALINNLIVTSDKGPPEPLEQSEIDQTPFPTMTNNVYGLQHDLITAKILKSMAKAKASHRNKALSFTRPQDSPDDTEDFSSNYDHKESIRKFLLHRKLEAEKLKEHRYERMEDDSDDDQDAAYTSSK